MHAFHICKYTSSQLKKSDKKCTPWFHEFVKHSSLCLGGQFHAILFSMNLLYTKKVWVGEIWRGAAVDWISFFTAKFVGISALEAFYWSLRDSKWAGSDEQWLCMWLKELLWHFGETAVEKATPRLDGSWFAIRRAMPSQGLKELHCLFLNWWLDGYTGSMVPLTGLSATYRLDSDSGHLLVRIRRWLFLASSVTFRGSTTTFLGSSTGFLRSIGIFVWLVADSSGTFPSSTGASFPELNSRLFPGQTYH